MNEKNNHKNIWAAILSLIITVGAFIEFKKIYWGGLDRSVFLSVYPVIVFLCMLVIISCAMMLILRFFYQEKTLQKDPRRSTIIRYLIFTVLGIFPSIFLQFSPWGFIIHSTYLRILLMAASAILMTYALHGSRIFQKKNIHLFFPALILLAASLLLSNRIKLIVDYPFTLSWSEGNRYWDYSLLFRKDLYTIAEDSNAAAFLDLGRQGLWGIAYVWKNLSISGMRAWNMLLYFLPPLLFGVMVFKHKKIKPGHVLLLGLWTYAFLSEGPIYAPLLICAALILLAEKTRWFPLSILLIILAGYCANITRFTWIIGPPVWAFLLIYFREDQRSGRKRVALSLVAAVSGLIGGVLLPNLIPPNTTSIISDETATSNIFSSVLNILNTQDLLWNRLLPTETFSLGILPALLLITIPVLLILVQYLRKNETTLTKFEKVLLSLSLIGFLVIGIFVSVKIGGGSNLHNMDLFLVTLLLIIHIFWERGAADWFMQEVQCGKKVTYVVLFLLLYQCFIHLNSVKPLALPDDSTVNEALASIQAAVDEKKETGAILFIDQRQLLTFGQIEDVPLYGEYEKKLMMNEAMSSNAEYFDPFYRDLQEHKFVLIVNEPINITYQEDDYNFGEENDAYVKWVSEPLLCYYEPLQTYAEVGVELLVPRTSPIPDFLDCP